MAGSGGARSNAGAKKGQHRVHVQELRAALEKGLGKLYPEHLNDVYQKLFIDFQSGTNTKEFLIFNENMNKRILADQIHEVNVSTTSELTNDEINDRLNNPHK